VIGDVSSTAANLCCAEFRQTSAEDSDGHAYQGASFACLLPCHFTSFKSGGTEEGENSEFCSLELVVAFSTTLSSLSHASKKVVMPLDGKRAQKLL
jgi:hypothetical protein